MTNQEPASILLIDDHPMLRTGVKQLVSMAPDITVVGEASNGEQGIELAESLDPDLILLDLNMPGMNGLETLDKLREKSLSGRVVVFSVSNHEEDGRGHRPQARGRRLSAERYGAGRSAQGAATGCRRRDGAE